MAQKGKKSGGKGKGPKKANGNSSATHERVHTMTTRAQGDASEEEGIPNMTVRQKLETAMKALRTEFYTPEGQGGATSPRGIRLHDAMHETTEEEDMMTSDSSPHANPNQTTPQTNEEEPHQENESSNRENNYSEEDRRERSEYMDDGYSRQVSLIGNGGAGPSQQTQHLTPNYSIDIIGNMLIGMQETIRTANHSIQGIARMCQLLDERTVLDAEHTRALTRKVDAMDTRVQTELQRQTES